MELGLKDKVVVITGGASGIGKGAASAFAREGAKVAVCDFSDKNLEAVTQEFAEKNYPLYTGNVDVRIPAALAKFAADVVKALGGLDVWINNAGINRIKPFFELTEEDYDAVLTTNLKHAFWGTRAAAEEIKKLGKGGVIINTSSFSGVVGNTRTIPYSASKAGILNLTKTTAAALAPFGIRVNAVVPGVVVTPLNIERVQVHFYDKPDPGVQSVALQTVSDPDEIANLYVYLASDAACYITGESVEWTGGKMCAQDVYRAWEDQNIIPPIPEKFQRK
jgi:NAD(P)-dependent dehydrogenase (short-subunit alcohol dehydrogenase family)